MFTAEDLRHDREVKDKIKFDIYKRMMNQCLDVIKSKNGSCSDMWIFHEVPLIVPGEPLYESTECLQYMIPILKEYGFWVKQCKPGNILFVSWHPEHCKKTNIINQNNTLREVSSNTQTTKTFQDPIIENLL
jgi:hypothetical protein